MGRKKNKGVMSDRVETETEKFNEEVAYPTNDVLNGPAKKEKRKKKSKEVETSTEVDAKNVADNLAEENGRDKIQVKPKKRKSGKDKEKDFEEPNPASENIDSEELSPPKKRKKKKKSEKQENEDDDVNHIKSNSLTPSKSEEILEKRKKKRKHSDLDSAESVVVTDEAETSKDKVRKDKKTSKKIRSELDVQVSTEEPISFKKKKKKKKQKESEEIHSTPDTSAELMVGEGEECDVQVQKRKKKKKKKPSDVAGEMENDLEQNVHSAENSKDTVNGDDSISNSKVGKEKRKKKQKKVDSPVLNTFSDISKETDINASPGAGTFSAEKGKKKETLSADCGQTSELSSQNNVEEKQDAPVTGQWQGELFESKDRQNKFLRLLGGMKTAGGERKKPKGLFSSPGGPAKKGLFGSLGVVVSSSESTGNRAMTSDAAARVNQRLEEDYSRAMNLRLSGTKGAGFGFMPDPAEGKKFHIDVNKSKSVKFDE